MSDADNAGQEKELQLPSVSFTSVFFCACLVALVWMFVLFGFAVATTSVASIVVTALGSVLTACATIIGIFPSPKFPAIDPKVTRGVVAAILMMEFVVSVGWAGWSYYQTTRTIDVLSTVTLGQNIDVLPGGHAVLDLTVTAQRDTIVLAFRVVDHNGDIGSCVPSTSLLVTPEMAGNRGGTVPTSSGVPTLVDLPAGIVKIHFDIVVTNARSDQNCAVDLRVDSAKLQNK